VPDDILIVPSSAPLHELGLCNAPLWLNRRGAGFVWSDGKTVVPMGDGPAPGGVFAMLSFGTISPTLK